MRIEDMNGNELDAHLQRERRITERLFFVASAAWLVLLVVTLAGCTSLRRFTISCAQDLETQIVYCNTTTEIPAKPYVVVPTNAAK